MGRRSSETKSDRRLPAVSKQFRSCPQFFSVACEARQWHVLTQPYLHNDFVFGRHEPGGYLLHPSSAPSVTVACVLCVLTPTCKYKMHGDRYILGWHRGRPQLPESVSIISQLISVYFLRRRLWMEEVFAEMIYWLRLYILVVAFVVVEDNLIRYNTCLRSSGAESQLTIGM